MEHAPPHTALTPAGLTARIERGPEGTAVTLSPQGAGRWFVVGFMGLWLAGWAVGEVFAFGAILSAIRFAAGQNVDPMGIFFGLVGFCFLAAWLVGWTFGGLSAITSVTLICGSESVVLDERGWSHTSGAGPWRRTRRFEAGPETRVGLRSKDQALVVEVAGKAHILAQLGTVEDREWLRSRMRELLERHGASPNRSIPVLEGKDSFDPLALAGGWILQRQGDGTARLVRSWKSRLAGVGCLGAACLVWNGFLGMFLAASFELIPTKAPSPNNPGFWLFLSPFMAVGLLLLYGMLFCLFGNEELVVGPNRLEQSCSLFGLGERRVRDGGTLELRRKVDSEGDESWSLLVRTADGEHVVQHGSPGELRALGSLLAGLAGWKLEADEDLV